MSKSGTYLLIKENVRFEKYMGAIKNHHHKIAFLPILLPLGM